MGEGRIKLTGEDAASAVVSKVGQSVGELTAEALKAAKAVDDLKRELQDAVNEGQQGSIAAISAQLDDAIPKLREAEQALKNELKPAVDGNTTAVSGWSSALSGATKVLGAFGIGLGVAQIVQFGVGVMNDVGHLQDLHDTTGVATEDLQRLQVVGSGAGLSLDDMGRAVGSLSTRLAKGDASAAGAVQALGLNIKQLLAAGPTEAFVAIGEAVSRVADPMQKDALAADLFGEKVGRKLLPALGDLRNELGKVPKAEILSPAEVKAIDDVGDAWERAKLKVEAYAAKAIAASISGPDAVHAAERRARAEMASEFGQVGQTFFVEGGKDIQLGAQQGATAADLLANRLKALRAEAVEPLTEAQKANIRELKSYGESESEIARLVDASQSAVHRYLESVRTASEEAKKQATEHARLDAVMKNAASSMDTLSGAQVEAIRYYKDQQTSIADTAKVLRIYEQQVRQVIEADKALAAARKVELSIRDGVDNLGKSGDITSYINRQRESADLLAKVGFGVTGARGDESTIADNLKHSGAIVKPNVDEMIAHLTRGQKAVAFLGGEFDKLPSTIMRALEGGGGLKGVVGSFSTMMTSDLFGKDGPLEKVTQQLKSHVGDFLGKGLGSVLGKGLGSTLGSALGTAIGGFLPMAGSLIGPLINKLVSAFGPSKQEREGRQVVADFEKQFSSTTDMINKVGDAYRANGKTAEQAQAAIQRMWAAEKLGAEATRKALAEINEELKRHQEVTDAIHAQGFQSQDEIMHAADIANAAYEEMKRSGQYTEDQVTKAYRHYQELLAQLEGAAGEAARAWLKAHEASDGAVSASSDAMKSAEADLKASLDRRAALKKGLDAEAQEQEEGVIEKQQKAELKALDAQIQEKADAYARLADDTGQKMADAITEALRNIHIEPIHVQAIVDTPGRETPEPPPSYADEGFDLTRPHLARVGDATGDSESILHGQTVRDIVRAAKNAGTTQAGSSMAQAVADVMSGLHNTLAQLLEAIRDSGNRPSTVLRLENTLNGRVFGETVVELAAHDKYGVGTALRRVVLQEA